MNHGQLDDSGSYSGCLCERIALSRRDLGGGSVRFEIDIENFPSIFPFSRHAKNARVYKKKMKTKEFKMIGDHYLSQRKLVKKTSNQSGCCVMLFPCDLCEAKLTGEKIIFHLGKNRPFLSSDRCHIRQKKHQIHKRN